MTRSSLVAALALAGACNEYRIGDQPLPEPDDPIPLEEDVFGEPPRDWETCFVGYNGLYYNLSADHPDVEPARLADDTLPPLRVDDLDWWDTDHQVFVQFEPTADFGPNWWPVDDGLAQDPRYFAARYVGWLRAYNGGTYNVVFGTANDAWVLVDGEVVIERTGLDLLETETIPLTVGSGVHRIDIRYGHRAGADDGLRFRIDSTDAVICYPDYSDD